MNDMKNELNDLVVNGGLGTTGSACAGTTSRQKSGQHNSILTTSVEYGKPMLAEFCFHDKLVNCNHGAWGAVPRRVMKEQQRLNEQREQDPEGFYRYVIDDIFDDTVMTVAEFVGAKPENLVLLESATTAMNTVLKSLTPKLSAGDKFLTDSHNFPAVRETLRFICNEESGLETITLDPPFPIESEDQIIKLFTDTLDADSAIKVVVIDHITSCSGIKFPLERLIPECHKRGRLIVVDGAHAPGQIPLNLEALGADYYIGNLHKWLFTPRGTALLFIQPKHQSTLQPLVTSYLQRSTKLRDKFTLMVTRDYNPIMCAPYAIQFLNDIGGLDGIIKHNETLIDWAANMLAEAWGTRVFPLPQTMRAPMMRLVQLPPSDKYERNSDGAHKFNRKIFDKATLHVFINFLHGCVWVRIASQVYNCKEDYYYVRDVIRDMLQE